MSKPQPSLCRAVLSRTHLLGHLVSSSVVSIVGASSAVLLVVEYSVRQRDVPKQVCGLVCGSPVYRLANAMFDRPDQHHECRAQVRRSGLHPRIAAGNGMAEFETGCRWRSTAHDPGAASPCWRAEGFLWESDSVRRGVGRHFAADWCWRSIASGLPARSLGE